MAVVVAMTEPRPQSSGALHSLLRNPMSVIAPALACFLVVLALLSARVMSGREQALSPSSPGVALVSRGGHTILRTTASGRVLGPQAGVPAAQAGATRLATLVTRTSGLPGEGAHDD